MQKFEREEIEKDFSHPSKVLSDDLEGWDGGWVEGRFKREVIDVFKLPYGTAETNITL